MVGVGVGVEVEVGVGVVVVVVVVVGVEVGVVVGVGVEVGVVVGVGVEVILIVGMEGVSFMGRESRRNPFGNDTTVGLPALVRDAYQRPLSEGDLVQLVNLPAPPLFQIAKISPVMNPNAPPNLMEVVLYCKLPFHAPRNQPASQFIRVLTRDEARTPAQREQESQEPPPSEEQPGGVVESDRPALEIVRDPAPETESATPHDEEWR